MSYRYSSDYYPFGSSLPTRSWSDASRQYRYGFNGKEKDSETANDAYDFGARIYDGRLGVFHSLDFYYKKYPFNSPYNFATNNPIIYVDPDGNDWFYYIAKGETIAGWYWHDGTPLELQTGVDNEGKPTYTTLKGHAAVVIFDGSRNEALGAGNSIVGVGAVTAIVTVYGPLGKDDKATYTGYTMTSNAPKFTPIDEGLYSVKRRKGKGKGLLPKHYQVFENGKDNIRTMDGVVNNNVPTQKRKNGDGYKTAIFIHRTNLSGTAGGTVSTGCLLIAPKDMQKFDEQLSKLGNALDGENGSRSFTLIVNRKGSEHNHVMEAPKEYTEKTETKSGDTDNSQDTITNESEGVECP